MTGHAYVIRQQDRNAAIAFIEAQMSKNSLWPAETKSQRITAEQEYREARNNAASFNAWCRKWLDEIQWKQIKEAICITRNRQEESLKYIQPHKTISVTHHAWQILSDLAQQEHLTLSEVIISRLGGEAATVYTHTESSYNLTTLTTRRVRS